ncbi:hypothetical protein GGS20DRAFT_529457 [Poronia punctata]|nr:hypothetical protein GGS20DRAFT_529457 [Poronia punctata]
MSGKKPLPSPLSPPSVRSPDSRSRRPSTASSVAAIPQVDREQLAQALDKIHTSSKQEGVLTTFNDLAPPPEAVTAVENKGIAGDLVQNGLSGLYSRFKEAVGVSGKEKPAPTAAGPGILESALGDSVRKSSGAASALSKTSGPSLARVDTGLSIATLTSSLSEPLEPPVTSPIAAVSANDGHQHPFTKASSAANPISNASSKSASSSRQSIPHLIKSTSTVATANVSNVSAFRDTSRPNSSRAEDGSSRASRRISVTQGGDPHSLVSPLYGEGLGVAQIDKTSTSNRSRRDGDGYSLDGSLDSPTSPIKHSHVNGSRLPIPQEMPSLDSNLLSAQARSTARHMSRRPAVIDRINRSQTSDSLSRSSSVSRGTAEASPVHTSAHNTVHHESFTQASRYRRMKSGDYRIPGTTSDEGAPAAVSAKLESMRKQVLSKQFWMADETCKECFLCGSPFTAFRRKHHCRTCGCIFDSRCTSIISGHGFGVQGTLRCCKTCLSVILQRQDGNLSNLSDESADDTYLPAIFRPNQSRLSASSTPIKKNRDGASSDRTDDINDYSRRMTTPMMAIPATKRLGESSNRNSAVLEIDTPQLSRPSSSRSLRSSTSARPQSSGHRRHNSKHNIWNRLKPLPDDRAPFRKSANEEAARRPGLPAFHDDNVIDPDLAAYMSDESSEDEQMSIMGTMAGSDQPSGSIDQDKSNFGPYLAVGRRIRNRAQAEKSISGFSYTSRGGDEYHPRSTRRRNLSTTSGHQILHIRSPRPRTATNKGPSGSNETLPYFDPTTGGPNAAHLTRSSSMKGEKEPRLELNPASMLHVRKLLRQLLSDSRIHNVAAWEKALIPILLKCTSSVDPDIDRGDDIDIRHYVKLKKIPGGKPSDTSYLPGVVFTKKLALKTMPRRMPSPRVVIISFPIEYQRHQHHFMSLQPVIEQEREFLKQLVNRIITLRPQLLLTEKSVSGLALQMLSDAKIAVAYNVKPSVLSAVSRCLETEIISSVDMLALPPHQFQPGKSTGFEVKTFVNDEIPGRKKTYIFLSSHREELGCTIALRGASTPILAKLKHITEFMVYVVYNLKLESCLMRDSLIQLPTTEDLSRNSTQPADDSGLLNSSQVLDTSDDRQRTLSTMTLDEPRTSPASEGTENNATEPTEGSSNGEQTSQQSSQQSSQPHEPAGKLISLHETHTHPHNDGPVPEDVPMPTFYSDMVAKYETKILSASPFVKFAQPYLLMNAREQERRLVHLKRLRDQDMIEERGDEEKPRPQKFQLIKPEMVHQTGQKAPRHVMEILHAVHDAEYDKALYNYQTQTRSWENYIQGNLDLFDPYAHQNIVVLHSVVCTETKIPCVEPQLIGLSFYDEHTEHSESMDPDCTLGQYIEDVCYGAESTCTANGCDRKMYEHHRTYVHGEARITVFIDLETKGKSRGDSIMMWSYCKVCNRETTEIEMSRFTWKYSFGKYLELSFWSRGTHLVRDETAGGWNCPHDHHRDHIRYFGLEDKIVRVHYDPIDLLEIIVPRARITWKVEHDLNMKNDIFTHCQERWTRFTASVKARLKAIKLDNIVPEKAESCKVEVERLTKKIQEEHTSIVRKLQEKYINSKYYEVIPFNLVLREMLVKVAEWDAAFATFEADFLPSDKDIRRLTMIQLRKMFTDESKESLASNETSTEMVELAEKEAQQTVSDGDQKEAQPLDVSPEPSQSEVAEVAEVANAPTGPVVSPVEATLASTPEAIRERVEPLDLATPKAVISSIPSAPGDARDFASTPSVSATPDETPVTPTSSIPIPVTPTGSKMAQISVTEQVEQLRRKQQNAGTEAASRNTARNNAQLVTPISTSKVITERGPSRRAGTAVSPPMVRAISQPVTGLPGLPRVNSTMGKKGLGISKEREKATPVDSPVGHELRKAPTSESTKGEKKLFGLKQSRKGNPSSIPRFVGKRDSRVSTIRKHFEQLSREFEKEREKDRKKRAANMTHSRPFLQHSKTRATVEVYQDLADAVHEPGTVEEDATNAKGSDDTTMPHAVDAESTGRKDTAEGAHDVAEPRQPSSNVPHRNEESTEAEVDDTTHNTSVGPTDDEQGDSDTENSIIDGSTLEEIADSLDSTTEIPLELPKHDRMNFMKALSNFWNERSASQWPALDYPLGPTDHVFVDSEIIVREDEPSSVIAFALSSDDYKSKLRRFHRRKPGQQTSSETSGEVVTAEDLDKAVTEEHLETSLIHNSSSHYKYQFAEGTAKMLVKIFYAEQFDALRRKCGVADRIVESLSRCLPWDSKGGKTKSVFLKTQDDRLVMKSLSQIETQAFLKFAPAYFSIMAEALFHDLPSVIAKMLGFFQVVIKNPVTNTEIKLDLLLMENLFYDRAPTRIFDLKGSMRNRKIQSTGEQNEVLLDENMVEYIYESPLFAREHSKKLLRASVFNDTLFLARQNVMDYSLMIAVDEVRKELVVGIIDCIRTYTWDKKLESWIKDRGFAGGGRNRPTVTSPKEYKSRFREAMARYILQAPNCWHLFNAPLGAGRHRGEANYAGEDTAVTSTAL